MSEYNKAHLLTEKGSGKELSKDQRIVYGTRMDDYIQNSTKLIEAVEARIPICRKCDQTINCKGFRNFQSLITEIDNSILMTIMTEVIFPVENDETELPFDKNENDFENEQDSESALNVVEVIAEAETEAELTEPPFEKDPNDPGPEAPLFFSDIDDGIDVYDEDC